MNAYSIVLFVHVMGAVLLFVLLTAEGAGLKFGFDVASLNRVLGPVSGLAILVPGLYMAHAQWGAVGWIVVGIVAWLLIAAIGTATGITVMRGALDRRAAAASWLLRIGLAVGVLFVMTVKPDALTSVLAVVVGAAVGLAVGLAGQMSTA